MTRTQWGREGEMLEERDVFQITPSQRGRWILFWDGPSHFSLLSWGLHWFCLIRGHFCACPCGMSGMDHLDGKWVGQSAKLSSPEKNLTDMSHLLEGCSLPLWLQSGSFKLLFWRGRLRSFRPATFLWWQCHFLTKSIVPAVATSEMSGHWCTWLLWRSSRLLLRLPLLKEFKTFWRRTPGSQKKCHSLVAW